MRLKTGHVLMGYIYVTQGSKTHHLSFLAFFIKSYSTLHQNAFYSIKISCF